jgi:hypothetical protein
MEGLLLGGPFQELILEKSKSQKEKDGKSTT